MKKFLCVALLFLTLFLLFVAHAEEYGLGETWTVDGQWTLTIDSIEETADRNQFSDQNPTAVYIVTYTYANIGYADSNGIMDGLYLTVDSTIVDCDGMMGYSYPATVEYYAQEVPVGAKCKAQVAIGVETAGLPIRLYVDQYDGNSVKQSAVFVLGSIPQQTPVASTEEVSLLDDFGDEDVDFGIGDEALTISDILPDEAAWGMSSDAFQQAYPASYTSTKIGKSPALVRERLTVEGYQMNGYYIFADGALSKIVYGMVDNSDKSVNKQCVTDLSSAMAAVIGRAGTEGKGVVEWDNPAIQIGTAKLEKYTGNEGLSACIIFKSGSSAGKGSSSSGTQPASTAPSSAKTYPATPLTSFYLNLNSDSTITLKALEVHDEECYIPSQYTVDGHKYTVTYIDDACFFGRSSLEILSLPEGVKSIEHNAFNSCAIRTFYFPSTLQDISGIFSYIDHHKVTIYYAGTESQWQSIKGSGKCPSNVNLVFNTPVLNCIDNTDYSSASLTTEKSTAEELGSSLGNAVNGLFLGLLGEDD